jgi:hypothetical protein
MAADKESAVVFNVAGAAEVFAGVAADFFTVAAGLVVFLIVCAVPSAVTNTPNARAAKMVFSNLYIIKKDGRKD